METKIILYSQPSCPQCRMFHMLLDNKGITYTEIQDVNYMASIGIEHTPVLEVNGVRLTGAKIREFIITGKLPDETTEAK